MHIFDFANWYRIKHSNISNARDYQVSDKDFEEFMEYVKKTDFTYETMSEILLDSLISTTNKENYYKFAEQELNALKNKLEHNLTKDLELFKEEIRLLLGFEIVERYYLKRGRINFQLHFDKEIEKSKNILNNAQKYANILNY